MARPQIISAQDVAKALAEIAAQLKAGAITAAESRKLAEEIRKMGARK